MIAVNKKKLQAHLDFQAITLATMRMDGYAESWLEWEEIGRCYYYLRDPRATDYLARAAAGIATTEARFTDRETAEGISLRSKFLFRSASLYRLAAATTEMGQTLHQINALHPHPQWLPVQAQVFGHRLALAAIMQGNYAAAYAYQEPILSHGPFSNPESYGVLWSTELAYAALTHDADRLHQSAATLRAAIKRFHVKPWQGYDINLWDWYELADQLAESLV